MARIRPAGATDILRVVDMIEALTVAVNGPVAVNRAHTAKTVAALISSPDGAVWVSEGGFIAGVIRCTVISPEPIATELGWYASDGSGLRLLKAFEKWATDKGARLIQMSTGAEGIDLSRLGYRLAERAWVK
ncbi:hypothetical protein D3P04_13550 [Paracoccus onubensis]|uniref:N-acetyltransferase domain-containing protein n=1 Tax=Paracoccus onubensis TaxID=1675788 RepID=A0A418SST5_9RHOB|nr:hypothetical protein D3P04_13550 [Paracoccus onubensis]